MHTHAHIYINLFAYSEEPTKKVTKNSNLTFENAFYLKFLYFL